VVVRVLTRRVIPCLDTRDGRVVKGRRFADLRDVGSPVELACRYEEEGADEIVVLDVVATVREQRAAVAMLEQLRPRLGIPLTVGGGVRSLADARRLLAAGADKVGVNTAALRQPGLIDDLANEFGSQCVTLAIDAAGANGRWEARQCAGREPTGRDVIAWAREAAHRGAGEILLTSIDRDGTKSGYDLPLTLAVSTAVSIPVIASGGARTVGDFADALLAGADAVLAASVFHQGELTIRSTKHALRNRGLEIRL
jgi:cyclase